MANLPPIPDDLSIPILVTIGGDVYGRCPRCGKYLHLNTLLGTIHWCRKRSQNEPADGTEASGV